MDMYFIQMYFFFWMLRGGHKYFCSWDSVLILKGGVCVRERERVRGQCLIFLQDVAANSKINQEIKKGKKALSVPLYAVVEQLFWE